MVRLLTPQAAAASAMLNSASPCLSGSVIGHKTERIERIDDLGLCDPVRSLESAEKVVGSRPSRSLGKQP